MVLRIYLAGNVALEHVDVLVSEKAFPGRQGRLAFAILVVERSRAVAAEHLADILWDGTPPTAWQTAVRALMSKLRGVLASVTPDAAIEHAFGCYQLRLPVDAWVDLEVAAASAHEAEAALRAGDLAGANGAALVANAIARRPFLPGDDGAWVEEQRTHLHDVRVRALTVRAAAALAAGDAVGSAADAERVIALEPYRESAYVQLMRAHVAAGNTALALATYERLRSRLSEDLGTDPSPATEAVFLEIVRRTGR
jgi:DNA-binding SARP family transcriptional activator